MILHVAPMNASLTTLGWAAARAGLVALPALVAACRPEVFVARADARAPAREPDESAPAPLCGVSGVGEPWPAPGEGPDLLIVERTGALADTPALSWLLTRCGTAVHGESCEISFRREPAYFGGAGVHLVAEPTKALAELEARLRERFRAEGFVELTERTVSPRGGVSGSASAWLHSRAPRERAVVAACVSDAQCTLRVIDQQQACDAPSGVEKATLAPSSTSTTSPP